MSSNTSKVGIFKIDVASAQMKKEEDVVAAEVPLHIFLGSIHLVSILCSPTKLKELVVGHLLAEGLVSSLDEIADIDFEENKCVVTLQKDDASDRIIVSKPFARLIVSACGSMGYSSLSELLDTIKLKPPPQLQVEAKTISESVRQLNKLADTFRKTGGVHVAGLFRHDGRQVGLAEDVGRHNAVDKAIGEAALSQLNLGECFLALSGRMTADIVLKAARVGIPIVSSLAAAVDSGVKVARKCGVTLVGFVRGNRMNAYAHPERIKLSTV